MNKNQKSDLGIKLSVEMCTELPPFSKQNIVVIRDVISIFQRIDGITYFSFSNLGHAYLDHVLKGSYFGNVFDRYDGMSIKTGKRL